MYHYIAVLWSNAPIAYPFPRDVPACGLFFNYTFIYLNLKAKAVYKLMIF